MLPVPQIAEIINPLSLRLPAVEGATRLLVLRYKALQLYYNCNLLLLLAIRKVIATHRNRPRRATQLRFGFDPRDLDDERPSPGRY